MSPPIGSPTELRVVPRDGALLLFDRVGGANVLVRGPSTRRLRSAAPRVVLLGLSNACNLSCSFCSRDAGVSGRWDVAHAFELLAGLDRAGVLEVAFGGGEPLLFPGLDALVERLHARTSLAVHLTTNGVLLDEARLARLRPHVGEIRVSIHDDNPWRERLAALAATKGAFGANVLVTPERLPLLPALFAQLEELGCPDVALLGYVGADPALALGTGQRARLTELALRTTMRVRASVCFGRSLGWPVLDAEPPVGCGAGLDFVTLTAERTLRGCSFARDGVPVESAADVLAAWRRERARLAASVPLLGCGRDGGRRPQPRDGVFLWRAFSGNNSGDCFLVGKFERAAPAEAFVAALRGGFAPGAPPTDAWRRAVAVAGHVRADEAMPELLEAIGRTVLAHTASAPGDDFPALRALAWRSGARIVGTGIHEHAPVRLVSAIAPDDPHALGALEVRAALAEVGLFATRGQVLYAVSEVGAKGSLEGALAKLRALAERGVASAELVAGADLPKLAHALAARPETTPEWLAVHLWSGDPAADVARAARLAHELGSEAAAGGRFVLARARRAPARDGLHASRLGWGVTLVRGDELVIAVALWHPSRASRRPSEPDFGRVEAELRAELGDDGRLERPGEVVWRTLSCRVLTRRPLVVVKLLPAFAAARGLEVSIGARPRDPLEQSIARLDADVRALRRERRGQ